MVVERKAPKHSSEPWTAKPGTKPDYSMLPVSDEERPVLDLADDLDPSHGSGIEAGPEQPHTCWQLTLGWACMLLAVFAGASIGPIFKYMMSEGVPVMLASSWRNQTMVLSLIPMAVYEAWHNKAPPVDWFAKQPDLPFSVFVHVIISGVTWSMYLACWVIGLQFISAFKASVVVSCHPVLLVIAMRFTGYSVSLAEWIGVFVAFGGMFVSEYKPSSSSASSGSQPGDAIDEVPFKLQMFGYLMCLLAAAGEVVTILNRIKTRKYVPLLQYTLITSIFVTIGVTVLSVVVEDCWASKKWLVRMLLFGLWVGTVCFTGFNYAVSYIPPLIFSSISLVDPAVTAITSWGFGIEPLPGLSSWLGGGVVIGGVAIISYGERQRTQSEKAAAEAQQDNVMPHHDDDETGFEDDEGDVEMREWVDVDRA